MTEKAQYERPRIIPLDCPMTTRPPLDHRQGDPVTAIGGKDALDLMAEHGSPCMVFDGDRLIDTYNKFLGAFKKHYEKCRIAYSVKTNYLSSIVGLLYRTGSKVEVVSGFEYQICRRLGIPGREICFNGPWKKDDEIAEAFRQGSLVNLDNYDELKRVEVIAREIPGPHRIGIRVNMEVSYPPWDKFGFNLTSGEALRMAERIHTNENMELHGLHMHVGTYIPNPDQYGKGASALVDLALLIRDKVGVGVAVLDMGGGYASSNTLRGQMIPGSGTSPTPAMYAEALTEPLIRARDKHDFEPMLVLEPGRAMVDECGDMLTSVTSVKPLLGGGRAAIIDAGVNVIPTAYWYDHEVVPVNCSARHTERVKVFGPLCMQIDVIRPEAVLPSPRVGDVYCLRRVGAYNFSQSMQFIYTRPSYLLSLEGEIHVIRPSESTEDVIGHETIPDILRVTGDKADG